MANYGTGLDASFGIGQESSSAFNVAVAPTKFFPLTSDTVSRKKNTVQSMGLRGGLLQTPLASQRRVSTREATGNVVLDVADRGMTMLFKNMLGNSTSTNSGSAYTWTHTMAGTKGLSFTAQFGRPSADGTINNFQYSGGKISDWEINFSTDSLISMNLGMDFADELTVANSPTPTITQTGTAGSTTYYYRVSAVVGGVEQPAGNEVVNALANATLNGTNFNVVSWTAVPGATSYNIYRSTTSGTELKIGTSTTTSYNDQSNTAGTGSPINPIFTTPTYAAGMSAFSFTDVNTLTLGGSAVAAIKKLSVKSGNPLKGDRFYLGSAGVKAEQVINGYRTVTGTMEAEFTSLTALYAAYAADKQLALQVKAVSPNIITGTTPYSLQIDVPALFLDGDTPNIGGPDILTMSIPFTALYDGTNSPITITQVTTDTTSS